MTDNPVFRRRCFLRGTSNMMGKVNNPRLQLNLHHELIEKIGWKVNDNLKVDVSKHGSEFTLKIVKG